MQIDPPWHRTTTTLAYCASWSPAAEEINAPVGGPETLTCWRGGGEEWMKRLSPFCRTVIFVCVRRWCLFSKDLHFCVCVIRFSWILRPQSLEIQNACQSHQSFRTKQSCHLDGLKKQHKPTPQNNKQNALFYQAVTRSPYSIQASQRLEKAKRKIWVFILIGGTKLIKVIS